MPQESKILKYVDIPFAYSFVTFFLFPSLSQDFISTATLIVFFSGIFASCLELIDPIARFTNYIVTYKMRNISYRSRAHPPNTDHNIRNDASRAFNSDSFSKLRNKITGIVYLTILVFLSLFKMELYQEFIPSTLINSLKLGFLSILLTLIIIIIYEINSMPTKLETLVLYFLKISGTLGEGNTFEQLGESIDIGDWTSAFYWFERSMFYQEFERYIT